MIDQILNVESGGDPLAKNPRSTATGLGQFIESTWLDTLSRHRPDLVAGKSRQEILDLRLNPDISREMTAALASDNNSKLTAANLPVTPGNTYLAHFAGPGGAISVLNADPNASVASVLGPAVVKANPFLANWSVSQLRAWSDKKMGGAQPQAQTQAQPAPFSLASMTQAPAQNLPAFGWTPQQQQPAPTLQQAPQPAPQQQPEQPPWMVPPLRRPPDMTQLIALLQRTPAIAPGFRFAPPRMT